MATMRRVNMVALLDELPTLSRLLALALALVLALALLALVMLAPRAPQSRGGSAPAPLACMLWRGLVRVNGARSDGGVKTRRRTLLFLCRW